MLTKSKPCFLQKAREFCHVSFSPDIRYSDLLAVAVNVKSAFHHFAHHSNSIYYLIRFFINTNVERDMVHLDVPHIMIEEIPHRYLQRACIPAFALQPVQALDVRSSFDLI